MDEEGDSPETSGTSAEELEGALRRCRAKNMRLFNLNARFIESLRALKVELNTREGELRDREEQQRELVRRLGKLQAEVKALRVRVAEDAHDRDAIAEERELWASERRSLTSELLVERKQRKAEQERSEGELRVAKEALLRERERRRTAQRVALGTESVVDDEGRTAQSDPVAFAAPAPRPRPGGGDSTVGASDRTSASTSVGTGAGSATGGGGHSGITGKPAGALDGKENGRGSKRPRPESPVDEPEKRARREGLPPLAPKRDAGTSGRQLVRRDTGRPGDSGFGRPTGGLACSLFEGDSTSTSSSGKAKLGTDAAAPTATATPSPPRATVESQSPFANEFPRRKKAAPLERRDTARPTGAQAADAASGAPPKHVFVPTRPTEPPPAPPPQSRPRVQMAAYAPPVYVEVVRKKAERAQLPGHTCADCKAFFDEIASTHGEAYARARVQQCSRHRAQHVAPSTPPHFWSLPSLDTVSTTPPNSTQGSTESAVSASPGAVRAPAS